SDLPKETNKSAHLSRGTSGWSPTRAGFARTTKTDMVTACKAHRVLRHAHSVMAAIVAAPTYGPPNICDTSSRTTTAPWDHRICPPATPRWGANGLKLTCGAI